MPQLLSAHVTSKKTLHDTTKNPHAATKTAAAAAAVLRQPCLTLCDPIDSSPPGSPVLGFSRQEAWSGLPFPSPMHESEKWKWSRSVVSDSLWPHGLQPTRLLHPWDFPGKSTGVGCHCLLRQLRLDVAKSINKTLALPLHYSALAVRPWASSWHSLSLIFCTCKMVIRPAVWDVVNGKQENGCSVQHWSVLNIWWAYGYFMISQSVSMGH